jgi:hypothetical protein
MHKPAVLVIMDGVGLGDGGLGGLAQGGEGLRVLDAHLREDLAVELDAGQVQAVHELRVAHAVQAGGGVDTGDPELADLALLGATIAILVHQRVTHLLLGLTVATRTLAVVALGHLQDATTLLTSGNGTLNTSHDKSLLTNCNSKKAA